MYIIRRVAAMAPVMYTRVYLPAYDADHVKATSSYGLGFEPYLSLNPALPGRNPIRNQLVNPKWDCI